MRELLRSLATLLICVALASYLVLLAPANAQQHVRTTPTQIANDLKRAMFVWGGIAKVQPKSPIIVSYFVDQQIDEPIEQQLLHELRLITDALGTDVRVIKLSDLQNYTDVTNSDSLLVVVRSIGSECPPSALSFWYGGGPSRQKLCQAWDKQLQRGDDVVVHSAFHSLEGIIPRNLIISSCSQCGHLTSRSAAAKRLARSAFLPAIDAIEVLIPASSENADLRYLQMIVALYAGSISYGDSFETVLRKLKQKPPNFNILGIDSSTPN